VFVSKCAALFLLTPAIFFVSKPTPAQTEKPSVSSPISGEDETDLRGGQLTRAIQADLAAEKFEKLDRLAAEFRSQKSRLKGGKWKLSAFYDALDDSKDTDEEIQKHIALLNRWVAQRPESITPRVAVAFTLHRWAWVARGNGMADTITPKGLLLFEERIEQSRKVLEAAAKLQEKCPVWYSDMMIVGLAQEWDANRMKKLYEQAVQFEPEYHDFYEKRATLLLPKWGGDPGEAVAFAKEAADHLGGEAGDEMYYHIATAIIGKNGKNYGVHKMDWPRIQKGYALLTAKYKSTNSLKNGIAFLAWKFQDAAYAKQQFALIGDRWDHGVWKDRERFDQARDWSKNHS